MIKLTNGFEFKYCCASGALGFDGRGYLWERPFINPENLVVITKTLTFEPRSGNYRWWKFWKTFKINSKYTLNALGLPNPGYNHWISTYPNIKHKNIIPSICPFNTDETRTMVSELNKLDIRAIEVNISCPNTSEKFNPIDIIQAALECSKHPIIVKIGIVDDYLKLCDVFGDKIIIDAINTIPWNLVNKEESPLYPLVGGTSSKETGLVARMVLGNIKKFHPEIQVISGNGIFDYEEAKLRFKLGADAISFGTIFILTPWRPQQIINKLESSYGYKRNRIVFFPTKDT